MIKERLDILLVNNGLAPSRETAKALIMSGGVYVNGQKHEKPGERVDVLSALEVKSKALKYVSRGGLKLEKAIETFMLTLNGKTCIDVGASTGGFTDCMLKYGAHTVYAVDVGHGQLDWGLRNDERVTVLEKTNARYLTSDMLGEKCGFASVDVSFISLGKILPVLTDEKTGVLTYSGEAVCLIKPQFECGRKYVGKKGVVKDKFVHEYVINKVIKYGEENALSATGLTFSPIKGPNGNIEYLVYFIYNGQKALITAETVSEAVEAAETELNARESAKGNENEE